MADNFAKYYRQRKQYGRCVSQIWAARLHIGIGAQAPVYVDIDRQLQKFAAATAGGTGFPSQGWALLQRQWQRLLFGLCSCLLQYPGSRPRHAGLLGIAFLLVQLPMWVPVQSSCTGRTLRRHCQGCSKARQKSLERQLHDQAIGAQKVCAAVRFMAR